MPAGETPVKFGGFVGRERELAELLSACTSGADSDAHLFLIHGEPGIGKTRLADELASRAKALGVQVLWGRCWEGEGAPAYWPWIQVVRSFLGALDPPRRASLALESEVASDIIQQVAQIVPDLLPAQLSSRPLTTDNLDPNEARFRLFDAFTNFLKIGTRSQPMLIVFDDLHDADEASTALLRFMARELRGAAITIVASYREAEVRRSQTLGKLVGELSREARSIPVGGMNESEVAKLVELRAGQKPNDKLVAKLCAATNGNPLFVDGIVRNLMADGGLTSQDALDRPFRVPSGVREAIRMRLDSLSPEAKAILVAAAAIGNELEFNLCRSVAEVSVEAARRLLDEAGEAEVVAALGNGRYRFSHALMRGTIYDELETNARVALHGKIANRMEELYRDDLTSHLAELAHHFREAEVTEKAIDYSIRAGQAAASVLAFTDAIAHREAALALIEAHGWDTRRRADLLALLAAATFNTDQIKSGRYYSTAVELYESIGCVQEAATLRIQLGTLSIMSGQPLFNVGVASEHFRIAESVLAKGPETVSLALLYARIAISESQKLNPRRSLEVAQRSMEISERLGARAVWGDAAAMYAQALILLGRLKEGFALLEPAFQAMVETNGSAQAIVWVGGGYSNCLGDPRGYRSWFQREMERPYNAHAPYRLQFLSFNYDNSYFEEGRIDEALRRFGPEHWAIRFWVAGEWETIAALEDEAFEAAERTGDLMLRLNWSWVTGTTWHHLGDLARAETRLLFTLDGNHGPIVPYEMRARAALALVYVSMNRIDEAAEQVARCRQIMAAGEDWRGLAGDVARADAVVTAVRGNFEVADRLFESALEINRRYHAAWQEAQTLHAWGRLLALGGDRVRAAQKFDAAIENHRARGVGPRMLEWLEADKQLALGGVTTSAPVTQESQPTAVAIFRKEGEFWTLAYDGTTFRLKDAKGLRYIAYLLARPGQSIHVHDLIEAVEGSAANGRTTIHAESEDLETVREIDAPGPAFDSRARSEYRTRLRDLQAELDEAERMNDLGRSEDLRTEIEMVGQELTRAAGFGGRARAASGRAERARGLVGKNIRSMVERIRGQHPALGRHFASAISTGYFCAYQPEPDRPISWQL